MLKEPGVEPDSGQVVRSKANRQVASAQERDFRCEVISYLFLEVTQCRKSGLCSNFQKSPKIDTKPNQNYEILQL